MQQTNNITQYTKKTLNLAVDKVKDLAQYVKHLASPLVNSIELKIQDYGPQIQKIKEFYGKNKEIILIVLAAGVTYYYMKPSGQNSEQKSKTKKDGTKIKALGSKTFISDNSDQYIEQPSGATRRSINSSGKQQFPKVISRETKILQRIESFSQQQQNEDKIFFEMYKTYQNNGQ